MWRVEALARSRGPTNCVLRALTQALSIDDTGPEERKVTQAIIPDLGMDLRALPECAQDIAIGNLTGDRHMTDLKTLAGLSTWPPVCTA